MKFLDISKVHFSWILFFKQQRKFLETLDDILHLQSSRAGERIYPASKDIFKIFESPLNRIRVVIVGQDPYYCEDQANGIAFGVNEDIQTPPSLKNILKKSKTSDKTLVTWTTKGIFLLNAALTVIHREPNAHQSLWKPFTEACIRYISDHCEKAMFMLWGSFAQSKASFIDPKHTIVRTTHPSPLAATKKGTRSGTAFMDSDQFDRMWNFVGDQ